MNPPLRRPPTRRWWTAGTAASALVLALAAPGPGVAADDGAVIVAGTVADGTATPLSGATVDVYGPSPGGEGDRAAFGDEVHLASTLSGPDGRYLLTLPGPGCHRIRVGSTSGPAAPRPATATLCVDDGETRSLDLVAPVARVHLAGRLIDGSRGVVPGGRAELRALTGDGTPGRLLAEAATDPAGWYGFHVAPGCYAVRVIAPDGTAIDRAVCADPDPESGPGAEPGPRRGPDPDLEPAARGPVVVADAVIDQAASGSSAPALTAVEREILRLTNELRAAPHGPLARHDPLPDCIDDPYFGIDLDAATGQPEAVPALVIDPVVSWGLSRPWATRMAYSQELRHRTSRAQVDTYSGLGVEVVSWGENIAWAQDFDPEEVAWTHFTGWRESSDLHYCSLITDRFTHVGVGEVRVGSDSWAAQNLYRLD